MSIASRLTLLFLLTALLLGSVAAVINAQREYQLRLESIVSTSAARLSGHPELQYLVYAGEEEALGAALVPFLASEAVSSALVYTGTGELVARKDGAGSRALEPPPFSTVRGRLMTADAALVSIDTSGQPINPGLLASISHRDTALYHSLPLITAVNSSERGLDELDFARAQLEGTPGGSLRVMAYLHLLIDRDLLVAAVVPSMVSTLLLSLAIALLSSLAAWYVTRRINRSLTQLAQLADEAASGNLEQPVQIEGSKEIGEIARVFNGMVGGFSHARKEANIDRRLLSMKVEERSAQLIQRNRELDHAVEEATQTRQQLHQLSNYDAMTRLPNRRLFAEQLDLLLKLNKRNKHTLALLFIDVEDYKRVNDTLGLSAGDQLLHIVAERLTEGVRESDSIGYFSNDGNQIGVSRMGSDEFTVVLNQLDSAEAASLVAERLLEKLRQPLDIHGHELVIAPSVGIAFAPADGTETTELLRAASIAKLQAKGKGAALEFYNADLGSAGEERLRLESDLRKAIERKQLLLHYQPQVDCHSGSVVGAEALLRWNHDELGQIPPGRFIGIAEEIGLMDAINDWVLCEACEQLKRFNADGIKLPKVAINVSSGQFSSTFVRRIGQVISDSGIQAQQLELGLSEAIMTSHEQDTIEALKALKEIGVYLSVDDFGTGYSPINYLSLYPLDELKIDRSFLQESNRSESGAKLVVAIITMARSLGLKVLANGVESGAEFRFLTENGAQLIQGYLFSAAVPADELKPMLGPWHFIEKVQKLADEKPTSALDRLNQLE
jgi:diguanylate cyclase (GGDEF)-like protein